MSLYDRFELLDLDRDDGVKSFEAREIATGRPVKVHLFVHPGAPLQLALLKAIDRLSESERQRILERGKHEGTPFVVTDSLTPHAGLSEWVQAASRAPQPKKSTLETAGAWKLPPVATPPAVATPPVVTQPSVVTPAPPAPVPPTVPQTLNPPPAESASPAPSSLNQQFAELFPTAERPILRLDTLQPPITQTAPLPPPAAAPVPATPLPATAAPAPPAREPGEFTRMFQAPSAPVAAQTAPPPPPPQPVKEPGEFTRMFQAPTAVPPPPPRSTPAAPPPAAPPAPPPLGTGTGEFARFFETPSPAGPMPHSPAVQQPLTPQAPGTSGSNRVGDFTRQFGKDELIGLSPPAAPTPHKEPGEFTRMFQAPGGVAPPARQAPPYVPPAAPHPTFPASQPAPPPAMPPAAPKHGGPGDYTRQFAAPAELTFGQAPATPAPSAPSPAPPAFAPQAPAVPLPAHAAPAAPKSNLPLILGIVGIVVLAALIIGFFAMRPK